MELLNQILNEDFISLNDLKIYFRNYSYYYLILINPSVSASENNYKKIGSLLKNNETYWILNEPIENISLIVFGLNLSNIEIIRTIAEKLIEKKTDEKKYSISISNKFFEIKKIHCIIKKINEEKDLYQFLGDPFIVFQNSVFPDSKENYEKFLEKYKEKLQNDLWTHNWNNFCSVFTEAISFCQTEKIPKTFIKKFLFRLTVEIEKVYGILSEYVELNVEHFIQDLVKTAKDFNDLSSRYIEFCMKIFSIDNNLNTLGEKELIMLIEAYLKEKKKKKINIEQVCKYFSITQSKMNRLLKKHKNLSFIELYTVLKIEEAKKILQEQPQISIGHLAYTLGFSDNLYFSKVFKKITSLSPTEYKNHYSTG